MPLAERGLALFAFPEFRAQQFLDHHIAVAQLALNEQLQGVKDFLYRKLPLLGCFCKMAQYGINQSMLKPVNAYIRRVF